MSQNSKHFAVMGKAYFPTDNNPIIDHLPVGTYALKVHPDKGLYLSEIDNFTLPPKIYGNNTKYAHRILNSFIQREGKATSAMLTGLKGSGKSITAKEIAILGAKLYNLPTIVVNEPFTGTGFNDFIQQLPDAIILFDEFEKVYNKPEDKQGLLTLLDGTFISHKLYVMTMNVKPYESSQFEFFNNRPGRIYFNIQYASITDEIVVEYCEDHLQDKTKLPLIKKFVKGFNDFTLDILSVLVSEMNQTGETPEELSIILNMKPNKFLSDLRWNMYLYIPENGQLVEKAITDRFSLESFFDGDLCEVGYANPEYNYQDAMNARKNNLEYEHNSQLFADFDIDEEHKLEQNDEEGFVQITNSDGVIVRFTKYIEPIRARHLAI